MKIEMLLIVVLTLIVGILLGIVISGWIAPPVTTPPRGGSPSTAAPSSKIANLENIVRQDPARRDAWAQLGHTYFDANQPAQAIEAYEKALALDGRDAGLLTDQGVMYRRVGKFERALQNFQRAQVVEPGHAQSLYNIGVVYLNDLKNPAKAQEAWEAYLDAHPTGPAADRVRNQLAELIRGTAAPAPGR